MTNTYAGIDIGRSGVKIMVLSENKTTQLDIIQPYAMPAFTMHDSDQAALAAKDTVTLKNGDSWFFGSTAYAEQEQASPGNFPQWSESMDYEALIAGAVKRIQQAGFNTKGMAIVGGLPAESSGERRSAVAETVQHYSGSDKVKIIPQSTGPFFLAHQMRPDLELTQGSVAIIDIGRYSTDFALLNSGRPVTSMFVSTSGVRLAVDRFAEAIRGKVHNLPNYERLEQAVRTGKMNINAKAVGCHSEVLAARADLSSSVLKAFKNYLNRCQGGVDHVVLAGGGASFVAAELASVVDFIRPSNDRFAVANGFMLAAYSLAKAR